MLHSHIRVGKDRRTWQDLDCYLFAEMLICVKERKATAIPQFDIPSASRRTKCTLKGSILIKKHLREVNMSAGMVDGVDVCCVYLTCS
jgi:Pleckstrin homology domain